MDVKKTKEMFRQIASKQPEKYFGVETLRNLGFSRHQCTTCGKYFWSVHERTVCGDPQCQGTFQFVGRPPYRSLAYTEVWNEFSAMFETFGYTPIQRYPVVARWRDDTDFVQASIYDFQPHVVSGAVDPPANPLVVPQFSLRFVDVENVGITGIHYTGFVMIGQHAFEPPETYDQNVYLDHIYSWLTQGLRIPQDEIIFHEDGWAGGGNGGACMEYFSGGLELGNQVYMLYALTESGYDELNLKVLDMGMGQERNAWFCSGLPTSYDAVFPTVMDILYRMTGFHPDRPLMEKFAPYAGLFNIDEIDDVNQAWDHTARVLEIDPKSLRKKIEKQAALYSIGEHTRGLLVALNDGALPSNIGGGYNLRALLRRCLNFIQTYDWDISLEKLVEEHARYLKPQFPELTENLEDIYRIIDVEKRKYGKARIKVEKELEKALSSKKITHHKLAELYQSHGVNPELLEKAARAAGLSFSIPRFEEVEKPAPAQEQGPAVFPPYETEPLYYTNEKMREFTAAVVDSCDTLVVLDKTAFYPTGGGQEHDTGWIDDKEVIDVFKEGKTVVHRLKEGNIKKGKSVSCKINGERRDTLTRHHTAAHLVNGASRMVLGNHVWQAGSHISESCGRLDITHYETLTLQELHQIEKIANEMVLKGVHIQKMVLDRNEAEKEYGFRLYQGGAVPGKVLRVLNIPGFDVEACGGTHADNTSEVGFIKVVSFEKISDAVLRLEFTAGLTALTCVQEDADILKEIGDIFRVEKSQVVKTAQRFFDEWKMKSKEIDALKRELSQIRKTRLNECFTEEGDILFLEEEVEGDRDVLRETGLNLVCENGIVILHNEKGDLVVFCGKKAVEKGYKANDLIKKYGRGGGTSEFSQGIKEKE
ncbi:MAG: alanine--tRNA ligase [Theionarchaea archaeon]|nr:alanine--tRNA ligase [Theionarchaea archaeon]MBU7001174.1 alanine--tRNA ligase [Theionarchaea archaeon]MBU7019953.1 alanine--tRNA ligase [Theionarchaea archaeon]MBU7034045.1 alanine--tRNA ligase [Theionarchaea archaeon]MBU7039580.1 alanine--tRNA ligase [Theionarchaea archaeon]